MRKYKINHYLGKLLKEEYDIANNTLYKDLNISKRTWYCWRAIKVDDKRSIPSDKLYQLAVYFGVDMLDLYSILPPKIERRDKTTELAKSLGLSK